MLAIIDLFVHGLFETVFGLVPERQPWRGLVIALYVLLALFVLVCFVFALAYLVSSLA